jgi:diguanylate cyclase (GGDEF)-like protein
MIAPKIPVDEERRIRTLRALDVLDTEAEERFDRVTRLARRLFDVPIALVSLVDADRQWFKSKQGLAADQTSRAVSFCGHAILGDETLVVQDATTDPRFSRNPLVLGDPTIRFYAGRPLAANGAKVGTLCLIDRAPRELSADDGALLNDLAQMVEDELSALCAATTDGLTGLSNRLGFEQLAAKALAVSRRGFGNASLLFVDMDGFKAINDRLGHAAGDRALVDMAAILVGTFRESDVIARIGGDEFDILLSQSAGTGSSSALNRLQAAVAAHNASAGRPYTLRCSTGIVDDDRASTLDAMLEEADRRMYEAKRTRGSDDLPPDRDETRRPAR